MYVTYYALSDAQYRFFKRLRWQALLASAALVGILLAAPLVFGVPHGLEPTGWPFSPVDWYGWGLALLMALVPLPGIALVYALQKLYIDRKVRRNSPGISAVAYPMTALMVALLLFVLILGGKLLVTAAWTVPSSGWPHGMIWSHGCKEPIMQVGFSPGGEVIYARLKSGEVRGWLIGRGKETAVAEGIVDMGPVAVPPFSTDSATVTLKAAATVLEFKRDSNKIKVLEGPGEKNRLLTGAAVNSVALSEDGLLVLSACIDNNVRMWDLTKNYASGKPITSHAGQVYAVACSWDKQFAISGGQDNKVRIWSLGPKKTIRLLDGGHTSPVKHVAMNADGSRAISASEDGSNAVLCVWDVENGKLLAQYDWRISPVQPMQFSMSPDGRYALTTESENLQLWRLP